MKIPLKKILLYSALVLLGLVIVFLVCRLMLNLSAVGHALSSVVGALRSIVLGCVMAYLLYPLTRFAEQFLLFHHVKPKSARTLSTAFSTIVLLTLIFLFAYFIIPQMVVNLPPLIQGLPEMIQSFSKNLSDFLVEHGQSTKIIQDTLGKVAGMFQSWLQDDPLSALSNVMERVAAAAVGVLNFIIGIIVMAYVLMSRDHFVGQGKKLLFALCRKRTTCDRILKHLRVINRIFTNFVSGKLLDSLIIGLLCAACLAILRIPYAGLISTIVGITNIIPVFGPFFGAIPSAFLLLLTDPYKCLVFLIFIVILQQVDGNIIGPKILGDSTGLSAFWVLFSLLLFNHLMGFWGMLLGVPLFASFYYLLREFINSRLKKKGLPLATQDYVHVAGIDENGTISYMPPPSIEFHPLLRGSNSLRAKIAQWLKHPTPPHRKSKDDTDKPDD